MESSASSSPRCHAELNKPKSTNKVVVRDFDELLDLIGPFGLWQRVICLAATLAEFFGAGFVFLQAFIGLHMQHYCRVPELEQEDNVWSEHERRIFSVPPKLAELSPEIGQEYHPCHVYDIDYSLFRNLSFSTAKERMLLMFAENFTSSAAADNNNNNNNNLMMLPATRACNAGWHFNHTTAQYSGTIQREWDLVCGQEHWIPVAASVSMLGFLVGVLIFGSLADKYGRRNIALVSAFMALVFSLSTAFAPSYSLFILLRFLTAAAGSGLATSAFVLCMEIIGRDYRSAVGFGAQIPFVFGCMVLALEAYVIRDWRILILVVTAPALLVGSYFWLFPESPRWLITQQRYAEAMEIIQWAARWNGKTLPEDFDLSQLNNVELDVVTPDNNHNNHNNVNSNNDTPPSPPTAGPLALPESSVMRLRRASSVRRDNIHKHGGAENFQQQQQQQLLSSPPGGRKTAPPRPPPPATTDYAVTVAADPAASTNTVLVAPPRRRRAAAAAAAAVLKERDAAAAEKEEGVTDALLKNSADAPKETSIPIVIKPTSDAETTVTNNNMPVMPYELMLNDTDDEVINPYKRPHEPQMPPAVITAAETEISPRAKKFPHSNMPFCTDSSYEKSKTLLAADSELPAAVVEIIKQQQQQQHPPSLPPSTNFCRLFATPRLRTRTLALLFIWFANCTVYYGLTFMASTISTNVYSTFFFSGLVELPALALGYMLYRHYGRRMPLCASLVAAGMLCMACTTQSGTTVYTSMLTTVLAILSKFFITSAFGMVYIYSSELFPTVVRSQGIALCALAGRLGSAVVPFINETTLTVWAALPLLLFGLLSTLAGLATLLLPETLHRALPETLEQAEQFDGSCSNMLKRRAAAVVVVDAAATADSPHAFWLRSKQPTLQQQQKCDSFVTGDNGGGGDNHKKTTTGALLAARSASDTVPPVVDIEKM